MGWYEWISEQVPWDQILDVGAGIGAGVAYLRYLRNDDDEDAPEIIGFDTDCRLSRFPGITVAASLFEAFGDWKFNVVTCVDVIEHIVDDLSFFAELNQFARSRLYITTPNLTHSHCLNEHHAREYTCAEFADIFKPDELWGGSPDGWKRERMSEPSEKWEHIAGVFYV